jgi:hypothetical protein
MTDCPTLFACLTLLEAIEKRFLKCWSVPLHAPFSLSVSLIFSLSIFPKNFAPFPPTAPMRNGYVDHKLSPLTTLILLGRKMNAGLSEVIEEHERKNKSQVLRSQPPWNSLGSSLIIKMTVAHYHMSLTGYIFLTKTFCNKTTIAWSAV